MLVREKGEWEERLKKVLDELGGAFSLLLLLPGKMIAARDAYGFRPLCIGKKNGAVFFSSESCAFSLLEADYIRDIAPGEIVVMEPERSFSLRLARCPESRYIVELIYFYKPD